MNLDYDDYTELEAEIENLEMLYGTHEPIEPLYHEHGNSDLEGLGKQALE